MKTINRGSNFFLKKEPKKKKSIDKTIIHGLENVHTFLKYILKRYTDF